MNGEYTTSGSHKGMEAQPPNLRVLNKEKLYIYSLGSSCPPSAVITIINPVSKITFATLHSLQWRIKNSNSGLSGPQINALSTIA